MIFKKYMPHNQHKSLIARILGRLVNWEYIERANPSQSLPSDFAVIKVRFFNTFLLLRCPRDGRGWAAHLTHFPVQVKPLSGQSVTDAFIVPLSRDAAVKHVIPQRRFVNILSAEEAGDDAHADIADAFSFDPFSIEFKGRKHSSFSEEEGHSTSTMRRLHSSLIQVPHLFKADYLWDRGYTGTSDIADVNCEPCCLRACCVLRAQGEESRSPFLTRACARTIPTSATSGSVRTGRTRTRSTTGSATAPLSLASSPARASASVSRRTSTSTCSVSLPTTAVRGVTSLPHPPWTGRSTRR